MKRKLTIVCLLTLVFVLLTGFSDTQDKIYDQANLLTETERETLQELLVETAQQIRCDLIVVTTNDNEGKTAMSYAEDFFMAHKFGYDTVHGDAVLLLIDMEEREIWISTSGQAKYVMTDGRISKTLDSVADYLGSGKYYSGCRAFANSVKKYYRSGSGTDNNYYSPDVDFVPDEDSGKITFQGVAIRLGIALVISLLVVFILRSNAKAKMTVDGHFYAKNNSCNIVNKSDVFVRTTVTKTPKPQSSGGGGHSSIHVGSGGHSFGGGGRKF